MMEEKNKWILMIDDDEKLCRLVVDYLSTFGFEVETVHKGKQGLGKAEEEKFDAVILDVMIPEMDGFSILKELRKSSEVPVIMLTALGEETDRVIGLEMGADDYLPKPFSTRELLARLRAITRRSKVQKPNPQEYPEEIAIDGITLDSSTYKAFQDGVELDLTALEFDLLLSLARSAGRILNRDQLLDEVSGRSYDVFDRSIDVHVSSLRNKLGDDYKNPRYIKTIRSVGYMFIKKNEGIK